VLTDALAEEETGDGPAFVGPRPRGERTGRTGKWVDCPGSLKRTAVDARARGRKNLFLVCVRLAGTRWVGWWFSWCAGPDAGVGGLGVWKPQRLETELRLGGTGLVLSGGSPSGGRPGDGVAGKWNRVRDVGFPGRNGWWPAAATVGLCAVQSGGIERGAARAEPRELRERAGGLGVRPYDPARSRR